MRMGFFPLLAAGAGLLLLKARAVSTAAQNIGFDIVGLKVAGFTGLAELEARLKIRFTNPTNQALQFQGLVLTAYYKGAKVGTCIQNVPAVIQAKGFSEGVFPLFLSLTQIGWQLLKQLTTSGTLGGIELRGFVQAGGVDLPVKQVIDISGFIPKGKTKGAR